jgi:hypothetical protein
MKRRLSLVFIFFASVAAASSAMAEPVDPVRCMYRCFELGGSATFCKYICFDL